MSSRPRQRHVLGVVNTIDDMDPYDEDDIADEGLPTFIHRSMKAPASKRDAKHCVADLMRCSGVSQDQESDKQESEGERKARQELAATLDPKGTGG